MIQDRPQKISSFVSRFGKPFSFIPDCKAIHQIWLQGRVIYLCSMTKALFLPMSHLVYKYAKLQGDIYYILIPRISKYVMCVMSNDTKCVLLKTFEHLKFRKLTLSNRFNLGMKLFWRNFIFLSLIVSKVFRGQNFVSFRRHDTFRNSTNFAYTLSLFLKCLFFLKRYVHCTYKL